jgi:hypothetical protein
MTEWIMANIVPLVIVQAVFDVFFTIGFTLHSMCIDRQLKINQLLIDRDDEHGRFRD